MVSCSPKLGSPIASGLRYLPDRSTADLITVEITAAAAKKNAVVGAGTQRALEAILFEGIPDSPQRNPIVSPSQRQQHTGYFNRLIAGDISAFITETYLVSEPARASSQSMYTAPLEVTINMAGLKRTLIADEVLPRFGL